MCFCAHKLTLNFLQTSIKYQMALNIILSSVVVSRSSLCYCTYITSPHSWLVNHLPDTACGGVLSFPNDVESLDYLNFQLPSALLSSLPDPSCASQVSTYTTEASQRMQILPSSLDLSLCSWA